MLPVALRLLWRTCSSAPRRACTTHGSCLARYTDRVLQGTRIVSCKVHGSCLARYTDRVLQGTRIVSCKAHTDSSYAASCLSTSSAPRRAGHGKGGRNGACGERQGSASAALAARQLVASAKGPEPAAPAAAPAKDLNQPQQPASRLRLARRRRPSVRRGGWAGQVTLEGPWRDWRRLRLQAQAARAGSTRRQHRQHRHLQQQASQEEQPAGAASAPEARQAGQA